MTELVLPPRLLTKEEAARYCGLSAVSFTAICPVSPLQFRSRLIRYDRRVIDEWLDGLRSGEKTVSEDWLERMG